MTIRCWAATVLLCSGAAVFGQQPDTLAAKNLETVVVTAYKEEPVSQVPMNIVQIKIDQANRYGSFNLTGLLAKNAGVSMLGTGVAIAKPVIRGLYGNRVLVLLNGLKFDNQQWQEEHGLGLTAFGLSKVELIKGPIGILYGTEAVGGVINLIEEQKPEAGSRESDVALNFHSNTLGGMVEAGYRESKQHSWWRIRVGLDNHADYADGRGDRVLNSRFDGYYLKSTYGFSRKNWTSTNNYAGSFNRFGFIFNDVYTFISPDERYSRRLNVNPAHLVLLNILSSENKIELRRHARLHVNVGVQSNQRLENEGGGAISLNMHLLTFQGLVKYECSLNRRNKLIISSLNAFEDNTNYGARKIVPDARMTENNLSLNWETTLSRFAVWENGAGAGWKRIKTFFTPGLNAPEKEIQPFDKQSPYYNAFSGITFFPGNRFNLKVNAATGVRVANLAELASDGLHEGVFTYEIGDPGLKNEQIVSLNAVVHTETGAFTFDLTPFYNRFLNYIYLAPTDEQWFGFPVYRYRQQDATQYGTEASVGLKTGKRLRWNASYSGMVSKTADGHTPYTPAQKLVPSVSFESGTQRQFRCFTEVEYCFPQNDTAPFEIATADYALWNAGASWNFQRGDRRLALSLAMNNILDKAYYDHLSRFKYFGLLNIGRNIVLTARFTRDARR